MSVFRTARIADLVGRTIVAARMEPMGTTVGRRQTVASITLDSGALLTFHTYEPDMKRDSEYGTCVMVSKD